MNQEREYIVRCHSRFDYIERLPVHCQFPVRGRSQADAEAETKRIMSLLHDVHPEDLFIDSIIELTPCGARR